MAIFKGSGTALVTPFTQTGKVDYEQMEVLIEEQIKRNSDAIIACGTTGESSTMTHEEHLDVVRFVCEKVKGRIPVIAGTGSNSTSEAIHMSEQAEAAGSDGLLIVTPYYNKATQKGLITHYKAIADAVKIPIILYHVPSRTGVTMAPQTIAGLCTDVPNIVGVKEASGNISAIAEIMNLADGSCDLYSGNDDQIVPLMSLGGIGVISVLSNIAPQQTHDICASFLAGDLARSCELQLKAIPLIKELFCEVNPIPVKAALKMMGMDAGILRLPLTEMEPQNQEKLAKAMKEYGLL